MTRQKYSNDFLVEYALFPKDYFEIVEEDWWAFTAYYKVTMIQTLAIAKLLNFLSYFNVKNNHHCC